MGQINELLAKVVAHNICVLNQVHELGLEPVFWRLGGLLLDSLS